MSSPPRLYPTDLSDGEWRLPEPLMPAPRLGDRQPGHGGRSRDNDALRDEPGYAQAADRFMSFSDGL